MTYKLMFKEPFYKLDDVGAENWFVNSYNAVDDDADSSSDTEIDAAYQKLYKVKFIVEPRSIAADAPSFDYIAGIKFASEADAVMFILRWS